MSTAKNKDDERFGGNRALAIKRDLYSCQICGMGREEHKQKYGRDINVDHIDNSGRNKRQNNNDLSNLRTLCQKCHSEITAKHLYRNRQKPVLIENYYKFLASRKRFFKSPLLILRHYGFTQIGQYERLGKSYDIVTDLLRFREIKKGHIVWRQVKDGWGFPWVEIFYNDKVLDKYGRKNR